MSESFLNRPHPGDEEVQPYPSREADFDPASEAYRFPEEAVFIGTEGLRPELSHGDVLEDADGSQLDEEELPD